MARRSVALASALFLAGTGLFAQGLDTQASKDDWEEINFDFNSAVLVDGFPSLLRIAELLQTNGGYHVRIEGHTDGIGSDSFNQKLGLDRANTVRDFLVKYGARVTQIDTVSRGKAAPKVPNPNPVYSPTDVIRFMNRRVVLTVTDDQGRTVGAGGPGDAIRAITNTAPPAPAAGVADCCSEVLKRLDKLDDIAKMLRDLADQNAALRKEVDGLRQNQQAMEARLNQPAPQPPVPPSASEVATEVTRQIDAAKTPKFQMLGANIGADGNGDVTFTGKGRFFDTMGSRFGFEAQGEYYYMRGQREGQFDVGLVDRLGRRVQAGLFASFKHVTLAGNQSGGTLGQGALAIDYLFSRGRIGIFGAKGFMDNALINRGNDVNANGVLLRNVILERYLKVVDQAGLSATVSLWGKNYLEGNVGYLKSVAYGDRVGGTVRLIFPLNSKIAFTAEGGVNETMLTNGNTGRAVFGVQFGNMIRPKEYLAAEHAIPMEVPRVRYEVVTRRLRIGNDPPIADAGPDLTNVPAGTVSLDGSASYDPDSDPITYQWTQEAGPQVSLTSPTTSRPTFNAAAGQTYIFRLVVKDDQGGQGQARVRISTRAADRSQILFFIADPKQIVAGQPVTLSWRTINADTVNISGIGNVATSGSLSVSPTTTTTYVLTARNSVNDETSSVTVAVIGLPTQVLVFGCAATPSTISPGQSATLAWSSVNAQNVVITPGIGAVANSGTITVKPSETTTYTVRATGGDGPPSTCNITVTVSAAVPVVASFTATPDTINAGQSSTLQWSVTNADSVSITSLGTVSNSGTRSVSPTTTTTYTLTATNAAGSVTRTATVTVAAGTGPTIVFPSDFIYTTSRDLRLDASGSFSSAGNNPLSFYWTARGTDRAVIYQRTSATPNVFLRLAPGNYIFDVTVTDSKGNSSTKTLTVRLIGI